MATYLQGDAAADFGDGLVGQLNEVEVINNEGGVRQHPREDVQMVLAFDRSDVGSRLAALGGPHIAAFLAACVERRKPAVHILGDEGRPDDVATFEATLEDLWSLAAGTIAVGDRAWSSLDAFDELESDEEAEGDLAFAEDAIIALWYATQFIRTGDVENALHCASRCVDSAGFLDDERGGSGGFGDAEIRIQLQDLADLEQSGSGPELSALLKERAIAEANRAFGQEL